jgi:probable H4MPT-linked C1 transfer pathway protein
VLPAAGWDRWSTDWPDPCVWGVDVGGANLKVTCLRASQVAAESRSHPFALWQAPDRLAEQLRQMVAGLPRPARVAVTMTGEIADCYSHKSAGVASIVDHCEMAFAGLGGEIAYYCQSPLTGAAFCDAETARRHWPLVAASNWHAVATLWGTHFQQQYSAAGLIADLGSTTLDLTPVPNGRSIAPRSDYQRMACGTLVYTGWRRSPLTMVLPEVEFCGQRLPLAQEVFATMTDVYLITGDLAANPASRETADGRATTPGQAAQRIARLLCSDADELPAGLVQEIAIQAKARHLRLLSQSLQRCLSDEGARSGWLFLIGEGEGLLRQAVAQLDERGPAPGILVSGAEVVGPAVSEVLPAWSVAVLGAQAGNPKKGTVDV